MFATAIFTTNLMHSENILFSVLSSGRTALNIFWIQTSLWDPISLIESDLNAARCTTRHGKYEAQIES